MSKIENEITSRESHDLKMCSPSEDEIQRRCKLVIPIDFTLFSYKANIDFLEVFNYHLLKSDKSLFIEGDLIAAVRFKLFDCIDSLFREYYAVENELIDCEAKYKKASIKETLSNIRKMFVDGIDELYMLKGNFESVLELSEWMKQDLQHS